MQLYIPIWFYSNPLVHCFKKVWTIFTFQSGSIQILVLVASSARLVPLHSNLVLFKWCNGRRCNRSAYLYIPIWFYSNNVKQMFEFHKISLYIPIWFYSNSKTAEGNFFWTYLYIPIWFYSNRKRTWLQFYLCSLYIPIWFYSNK